MTSVSVSSLVDLFNYAEKHGQPITDLHDALGLPSNFLDDLSGRVPESMLVALWQDIAKIERQGIGIELGQTINPAAKGLLASWISQAKNIEEASMIFMDNISLMNPSESWTLCREANVCQFVFKLDPTKGYPKIAIERSMTAAITWARFLSGQYIPVEKACFGYGKPDYFDRYKVVFGQNVEFNQSNFHALTVKAQYLSLPVLGSNDLLKDIVAQRASKVSGELTRNTSTADKVNYLLASYLSDGLVAEIDQIASDLSTTRHTLYRKLKEEGLNFVSLRDDMRKQFAERLLVEEGKTVTEASYRLGFQDTSSFNKAFKRWYGQSPTDFLMQNGRTS